MKTIIIVLSILSHLLATVSATPVPLSSSPGSIFDAQETNADSLASGSSAYSSTVKQLQQQRGLLSSALPKDKLLSPDPQEMDPISRALPAASEEQSSVHQIAIQAAEESMHSTNRKYSGSPKSPDRPCCMKDNEAEFASKDKFGKRKALSYFEKLKKRMPLPYGFDWYELGAHMQGGNVKKVIHISNGPVSPPPAVPKLLSKDSGAPRGWRGTRRPSPHREPHTS